MKKTIAEEYLGITARSFQQHLNVLYELCLVEFEEKVLNKDIVTDILVYPYPHYADTQACYLERHRNVEERDGLGVQLSRLGLEAKRKKKLRRKFLRQKMMTLRRKFLKGLRRKFLKGLRRKFLIPKYLCPKVLMFLKKKKN